MKTARDRRDWSMLGHVSSRVVPVEPALEGDSESVVEQVELEQRLRAAVLAGGLTVVYQPVVDLSTGAMVGVEALCRWHDARLGSVPPDQFIPLAEASGLIVDLGRWVLGEACRRAASWSESDGRPVVAVNVSPVQLREPTFVGRRRRRRCAASGLPAERLCLEITETAMVTDLGQATATLRPAPGPRRPAGPRRLRHRPLVADAAAEPAAAHGQDRPVADPQRRGGRPGRRPRAAGHRRGAQPRPAGLRRGRGGGRPGPSAGRDGLRHRPGLAVRPPGLAADPRAALAERAGGAAVARVLGAARRSR